MCTYTVGPAKTLVHSESGRLKTGLPTVDQGLGMPQRIHDNCT